jgi:hypothetical protein
MTATVLEFPVREPVLGFDALVDFVIGYDRGVRDAAYERSGYLYPSSLGYCPRRQVWEARGVPFTNPLSEQTLRTFLLGDKVEQTVVECYERAGLARATQTPLRDDELRLSGKLDLIASPDVDMVFRHGLQPVDLELREAVARQFAGQLGDGNTAIEVKSCSSFAFKNIDKYGPNDHHKLQVGACALLARRNPTQLPVPVERWELLYASKDDLNIMRFQMVERWVTDAQKKIEEMLSYLDGEDAPCTCPDTWEGKADPKTKRLRCPYASDHERKLCCGREA